MTHTRLLFLSRAREADAQCLIVNEAGALVGRETLRAGGSAIPAPMPTIAIVAGEDISVRWIELATATEVQAVNAASLLLKDDIAGLRESLHIAVGSTDRDGFRPVCVIERARMQSYVERVKLLGVKPYAMVPDHLMLPVPEGDALALVERNGVQIVSGRRLAFSAEPDLAAQILAGKTVQRIEGEAETARAFAAGAKAYPVDLLQQDFSRSHEARLGPRDLRRVAVLAAVLLLSPIVLWTAGYLRHEGSARALEAQAAAIAQQVPAADITGDPARYLRGRMRDVDANTRFLNAAETLFAGVAKLEGAGLENFSYLQEGSIRATLLHARAEDVAVLADTLAGSGLTLQQDSSVEKDGRLSTAIAVEARP